jgi:superfamily II DNA or RNA helicase
MLQEPITITINGTFINKSKIYSNSIIKVRLGEYLEKNPEKYIEYFDGNPIINLVFTNNDKFIQKENNKITIKANSDIDPENIIDFLIYEIKNFVFPIKLEPNIIIEGTFFSKSKMYSDGILRLKFDDFLNQDKENVNNLLLYCNNDMTNPNIKIQIDNTDNDAILFSVKNNTISIKGNSKIYSPEQIIDLLFKEINKKNQKVNINNNPNQNKDEYDIVKKLLSFQVPHLYQLHETIKHNDCILDASDTGTGKTYVAIALSHILNLKPFIICPKSVISNWTNVAKELNVEIFGVSNYESLKAGKYYTPDLEKVVCPYLDIIKTDKKDANSNSESDDIYDELAKEEKKEKFFLSEKKNEKKVTPDCNFIFQLPKDIIVIFDEAHRCKNHSSDTSKLLLSILSCKNKMLLLSATITDKILCFKTFGKAFGFYDDIKKFRIWMRRQKIANKKKYGDKELDNDMMLRIINDNVFPKKGSRMKICELGDLFPQNQIIAKLYYCNNYEEIQKEYEIIKEIFEEYKEKEGSVSFPLAQIMYARMRIEQFKIPIFIDLANEALDNGYSIVIFTCFRDTMLNLAEQLKTDCLIHGEQSLEERNSCIQDFQSNKCRVIIAMISAGNVGISLHDIHGGHPRMSLISPSWNGIELKQCLGRIHRAGSKSPALQRLIYCAKTYEEEICKMMNKKLEVIDKINDGMLVTDEIDMEIMKELDGEKKYEIVEDTRGILKDEKKKAKEQILGEKKGFDEYYKSGAKDADLAKEKVKSIKKMKIKR